MATNLQGQILSQLNKLSSHEQERVLDFAKALAPSTGNMSGKELLKFQGGISTADLDRMQKAIEEGCERVDKGEW
jgi:hypothetical protein